MSGSMTMSKEIPPQYVSALKDMLEEAGISAPIPENCNTKGFYSDLIRGHLKPQTVLRGRVTCLLSVTPAINVTISTLFFSSLILNLKTVWMLTLLVSRPLPIKDKREEMFLSFTLLACFVYC